MICDFPTTIYDQVIAFLKSRSAERIGHVKGTLLAHLEGTCALLRSSVEFKVSGFAYFAKVCSSVTNYFVVMAIW